MKVQEYVLYSRQWYKNVDSIIQYNIPAVVKLHV